MVEERNGRCGDAEELTAAAVAVGGGVDGGEETVWG